MQTLPADDVTVPRLTDIHITMTLTSHTGPTYYLWVSIETTGTPERRQKDRQTFVRMAASDWLLDLRCLLTSHSLAPCILLDTDHMTPDQMPPARRWD